MEHAMTNPSIDPARLLHEHLTAASPDLLRSLLTTFIDTLMSAEADAVCGAEYGTSSPDRVNTRNGYRHRDFDTRDERPRRRQEPALHPAVAPMLSSPNHHACRR